MRECGSDAELDTSYMRGQRSTEKEKKFENELVVKDRLTVEFSGGVFQTVDSLLMVQAN